MFIIGISNAALAKRPGPDKTGKRWEMEMKKYDKDKNGKFSLDEWFEKSKQQFKKNDKNNDSFIDKELMRPKRKWNKKK